MIKAVIFDFDGVICNSFEIAYSVARITNNNLSRDEYRDFFNGNIYNEKHITKESVDRFFKIQSKKFEDLIIDENIKKDLLELSKNFMLFIDSSNMEETIKWALRRSGIPRIFKAILGYESGTSKVEKFGFILSKYNLEKEECLFVTDTLGDILEANLFGIKTIAVDYGFHNRTRLEKGMPYKIVSSFDEVVGEIKRVG